MTKDNIIDGMALIDEDLVDEAEQNRSIPKGRPLVKWLAAAACLFLLVGAVSVAYQSYQSSKRYFFPEERIKVTGNGITFLPLTTTKPENFNSGSNMSLDMIGFLIHGGQFYIHRGRYGVDLDVIGKQVGTARTGISEGGFKDGDGIVNGIDDGVYALKGYNPDFLLCMRDTGYAINFYFCRTGYTLKTGSDLFEDRLHISRNLTSLKKDEQTWTPDHPVVEEFLRQLNDAPFMLSDDMPDTAEKLASATLQMKYNLHFSISLYSGGYVSFDSLWDVCLKLPKGVFEEFLDLINGTPTMNHTGETVLTVMVTLLVIAILAFMLRPSKSGRQTEQKIEAEHENETHHHDSSQQTNPKEVSDE